MNKKLLLLVTLINTTTFSAEIPQATQKDAYYDRWQETFHGDIKIDLNNLKGEIPQEIKQILECMQNRTGNCSPAYVFYGPPGNGKTALGKAIAKEIQGIYLSASSADFEGSYNGTGSARMIRFFERAKQLAEYAPVILAIDEIDGLAANLGKSIDPNTQQFAQTYQQLLTCLDSLPKDNSIILIGTTNRRTALDQALTRPERAQTVEIMPPNEDARRAILKNYIQQHSNSIKENVYSVIAKKSEGFCAAAFETMAKMALIDGTITEKSLYEAFNKITKIENENKAAAKYHTKKEEIKDLTAIYQLENLKIQRIVLIGGLGAVAGGAVGAVVYFGPAVVAAAAAKVSTVFAGGAATTTTAGTAATTATVVAGSTAATAGTATTTTVAGAMTAKTAMGLGSAIGASTFSVIAKKTEIRPNE
ncbi:hypothetical protein Noda2021_09550 [Candidatus Dependentiae bacterium Noda2021]|nr:hypothetical protein Noda2021_09550 [Candidatus Dependentiae bacterium Noda2021]